MNSGNADRRGWGGDEGVVDAPEILAGGGLLFGALMLPGCASRRADAHLPEPVLPTIDPIVVQSWAAAPAMDGYNAPSLHGATGDHGAPPPVAGDASLPPGVLPRAAWTRSGVSRPYDIYPIGGINRVTVHHDGMPPTTLHSMGDTAARIEAIRQAHVRGRGWADIGYHYVVDPSGRVWEGRSVRFQGAHVKDQNENNLGILTLGNFEVQRPTSAQLASLDRFLASQMSRYRVPMWRVKTHREIARTECPGRNLQGYMEQTRSSGGQPARLA